MASKRCCADLDWANVHVTEGGEPPDFFLALPDGRGRFAVEVIRIYRRERPRGLQKQAAGVGAHEEPPSAPSPRPATGSAPLRFAPGPCSAGSP